MVVSAREQIDIGRKGTERNSERESVSEILESRVRETWKGKHLNRYLKEARNKPGRYLGKANQALGGNT